MPLLPVSVEITYGLERILMSLQVWVCLSILFLKYLLQTSLSYIVSRNSVWKTSKFLIFLPRGLHLISKVFCLTLCQGVDHFKKIQYAPGITYGELFLENE